MIEVQVVRLRAEATLPGRAYVGDAGLDLATCERLELAPGERAVVPTGLAVAIPEGFAGFVHPRSGLAHRLGLSLVNAPGTIDAGYRGEISVLLVNHDPHQPIELRRGDRVAQLVVQRFETARFVAVDELPGSARGVGGYGSTGGFGPRETGHPHRHSHRHPHDNPAGSPTAGPEGRQ